MGTDFLSKKRFVLCVWKKNEKRPFLIKGLAMKASWAGSS